MLRFALCLTALCCLSAAADDKPKPKTAEEAVKALDEAKKPEQIRTVELFIAKQTKIIEAANAVLEAKDLKDADRQAALTAKGTALAGLVRFKPDVKKEMNEFGEFLAKEHPSNPANAIFAAQKFQTKYLAKRTDKVDPAALAELKELAKKYPKSTAWAQLYGIFANLTEQSEGAKAATAFVEEGLKLFPNDRQLKSQLKGLKIIGQAIEIAGPTLEGSEYNLANLKGKVVLVDFWATWCGPCIAELPHVKEAYTKYHEKGFEIVGVSLDRTREKLETFVKEKEMPWPQIIFSKEEEMFWSNPVAKKHEINSIPATYLIGRDGKVAARNLRGKALEDAVKKEIAKSAPAAN